MKAALDRLGNVIICSYSSKNQNIPFFNKVCGAITIGEARYGGQEFTLNSLNNSCLIMNGIVVTGNTGEGNYIGTASWLNATGEEYKNKEEKLRSKRRVLGDEIAIDSAKKLGKRVAEIAKIIKAGVSVLSQELPREYSYKQKES
ncbi:hypothetical protein ACFLS8_04840 [Chloroflexota bacterium]